jgi:triacylglycerol lipase
VVAGHSLGAALATYLSMETAKLVGTQLSACMFASPRTGDQAWANLYDKTVTDYRLFNYILDAVPYVPFDLLPAIQYSTLSNATIVQPAISKPAIKLDLGCNHHVVCYCAMLDYDATKASPLTPQDKTEYWNPCVLYPPREGLAHRAAIEALATLIGAIDKTVGGVGKRIVEMILKELAA